MSERLFSGSDRCIVPLITIKISAIEERGVEAGQQRKGES
jgi:hypothetical protein